MANVFGFVKKKFKSIGKFFFSKNWVQKCNNTRNLITLFCLLKCFYLTFLGAENRPNEQSGWRIVLKQVKSKILPKTLILHDFI